VILEMELNNIRETENNWLAGRGGAEEKRRKLIRIN